MLYPDAPMMAPDEVLLLLSSDDGETETQDLRHLDNITQLASKTTTSKGSLSLH